jgi:hypothetical protein
MVPLPGPPYDRRMPFTTGRLVKGDRIFVCVELTALDEQGNLAGASKAWRPATIVFHMPRVGDTEEQWCARVEGSNTPFWIFHETQWKWF